MGSETLSNNQFEQQEQLQNTLSKEEQEAVDLIKEDPRLKDKIEKAFPTPESRTKENMAAINKFALENKISPNVLIAYFYDIKIDKKEDVKGPIISQAAESKNNPKDTIISSKTRGTFYESYLQVGNINVVDKQRMDNIVLDFTGSMSRDQIVQMLQAISRLARNGHITKDTTFNIMYDIADQDGVGPNSTITTESLHDTAQKIKAIPYGINGETFKKALVEKGIMDDKGLVTIEKGKGSTPLYTTILEGLTNHDTKNITVFTDGASDRSADQKIGPEEIGNEASWNAMLHLCKNTDKKINIVAFNMEDVYLQRITKMQEYFKKNGAGNKLQITNLGKVENQDIAKKIVTTGSSQEVIIKGAETMKNDKVYTLDSTKQVDTPQKAKETPRITNKEITATFNQEENTYAVNLGLLYPGVDFSKYDIKYNIRSTAEITLNHEYPELSTETPHTVIMDLSNSMGQAPKDFFIRAKFATDPSISYDNLMAFKGSMRGFNKPKNENDPANIQLLGNENDNLFQANFDKPNNQVVSLVFKAALSLYQKQFDNNKNDPSFINILNKIQTAINNINEKGEVDTSLYNELLKKLPVAEQGNISKLYTYLRSLEKTETQGSTPLLEALSIFGGADQKLLETYKNNTVDILTDFGDNSSMRNSPMMGIFGLLSQNIGRGTQSYFDNYAVAQDRYWHAKANSPEKEKAQQVLTDLENKMIAILQNNSFVQQLKNNLINNGIKLNFISTTVDTNLNNRQQAIMNGGIPPVDVNNFFKILGKSISGENNNLLSFKRIDKNDTPMSMLFSTKVDVKEQSYTRDSMTISVTPKSGSNAPAIENAVQVISIK